MHFSSSISPAVFYFFENEDKLVALLVYSSFQRIASSGIRNSSVATRRNSSIKKAALNGKVNTESLRIRHSIAARHSQSNINDVSRLVQRDTYGTNNHSESQLYSK